MTFKVGDWVITSESCYLPNKVGFITLVSSDYYGVANTKGLGIHSFNKDGSFHLYFQKKTLKPYNKEKQLELNLG